MLTLNRFRSFEGLLESLTAVDYTVPAPSAILFNFIIGNINTLARAKVSGHWLLDEHDMAC